MAHNRAVFNAKVREQTEKMSWKDKVKTTATVVGVAGAFIPVVGDAISLAASGPTNKARQSASALTAPTAPRQRARTPQVVPHIGCR